MLGAISVVLLLVFVPLAPVLATGHIANFIFTTEPQTVLPDQISDTITVQARDAAGDAVKAEETLCFRLKSASVTGTFSSTSGGELTSTFNANWTQRHFTYKDSSPGSYEIKAEIAVKPADISCPSWPVADWNIRWTANQQIIIEDGTDSSSNRKTSSSSGGGGLSISEPEKTIKVYAGEDKVAVAGAETAFIGSATGPKGEALDGARFLWNFGDGEVQEGRAVSHAYRFTGEYTAGLYVSSGEYSASDYLKVKVTPNQIEISGVLPGKDGYARLKNSSDFELDLGGWILGDSGRNQFVIPARTKIAPRGEVTFASETTGFEPGRKSVVYLYYPNGKEAVSYVIPSAGEARLPDGQGSQTIDSSASPKSDNFSIVLDDADDPGFSPLETGQNGEEKSIENSDSGQELAQASRGGVNPQLFFWLAFGISSIAAAGFLVLKKFNAQT